MTSREEMVSPALRQALADLYVDPSIGLGYLGDEELRLPAELAGAGWVARARALRARLEGFVVNMARELEEFGDEERERLQAEARATLTSLRELGRFLPESAG